MYQVEARINAREYVNALSDLQQQQLPFAIVVALTRTAWLAKAAEQNEMRRIFNQPVPWTIDSIEVMAATKADPTARIRFKDERVSAGIYLGPQVRGGQRRHTPFEGRLIRNGIMSRDQYAVPVSGADRDGTGNLNPGQVMKILSDLETVDTAKSFPGARNQGARRDESYFATTTGGQRTSHLKPGIYKRQAGGAGIVPVFIFTTRRPSYRAVYAFDAVAQRVVDAEFGHQLDQALADAVRTSNHRDKWSR
jgi:hypothetical protein